MKLNIAIERILLLSLGHLKDLIPKTELRELLLTYRARRLTMCDLKKEYILNTISEK